MSGGDVLGALHQNGLEWNLVLYHLSFSPNFTVPPKKSFLQYVLSIFIIYILLTSLRSLRLL